MISLTRLSLLQKKRLEQLICDVESRFRDALQRKDNPQVGQQQTKFSAQDKKFPPDEFLKMVYFMLRQGLYGIEQEQNREHKTSINYDTLQKHLKFLYQKFEFPKIDQTGFRIKPFEQKQLTKENKGIFKDIWVLERIQRLANHTFIEIQQFLSSRYHEELLNCPEDRKIFYLDRLHAIVEDIEKNYLWERWKKEDISIQSNDQIQFKDQMKQIDQLNSLQLLYISYSRQALNELRLKNTTLEEHINDKLLPEISSNSLSQVSNHKKLENQPQNPSKTSKKTIGIFKNQQQSPIPDINTQQIVASFQEIINLQEKLKTRSRQMQTQMKINQPSNADETESTGFINPIQQTRLNNMETIDFFRKKEESLKFLSSFMNVYDNTQRQKKN